VIDHILFSLHPSLPLPINQTESISLFCTGKCANWCGKNGHGIENLRSTLHTILQSSSVMNHLAIVSGSYCTDIIPDSSSNSITSSPISPVLSPITLDVILISGNPHQQSVHENIHFSLSMNMK